MFRWFDKHRVLYISLIIIVAAAVLFGVTVSSNKISPDSLLGRGVFAVQGFFTSTSERVKDVLNYRGRKAQIEELTKENNELKAELTENAISKEELQELRELKEYLNYLTEDEELDVVTCDVIAADSSSAGYTFTIGKGTESGIEVGDTVVVKEGLVGRILETGNGYSIISTIKGDKTRVSFRLLDDMTSTGIVYGTSSGGISGYMMNSEYKVSEGDVVITSGMGDIPQGIVIGTVSEVSINANLVKVIEVQSSVDFNNLNLVMVLV